MTVQPNISPDDRPNDPSLKDAIIVSPVGHVGPTLESDPTYNESAHSESIEEVELSGAARSLSEEDYDTIVGPPAEPEPLKTRLPGDTSSDPHTDLDRESTSLDDENPEDSAQL